MREWDILASMSEFSDRVYEVVRQIPEGKVATYGLVARLMGRPQSARYVGFALRRNPEPWANGGGTPCHRVVFRDGGLCDGFAFGGPEVQRAFLESEGVLFTDETHVELEHCLWDGHDANNPAAADETELITMSNAHSSAATQQVELVSSRDANDSAGAEEAERVIGHDVNNSTVTERVERAITRNADNPIVAGETEFVIGCHLSIAKGFAAAARDAESIGANTFQFFTRNPRGGKAKALDPRDLEDFARFCSEAGIGRILAHAPYTLNPASSKPQTSEFALQVLIDDLARMEQIMPGQLYNMHPGAHVGQGPDVAIDKIAAALNQALQPEQTTTLLLETMSGKGSEVGRTFEELARIIERVELADHVGVCLDTCHIWDGGYDIVGGLENVLEEFERIVGLDRLKAIHLNDSKNPCDSHKDRHEKIGDGCIGFEALSAVTNHPVLKGLPFYLETPHDDLSGYAREITRLRNARTT